MASSTSHSTTHFKDGGHEKKYFSGCPIGQEVVPECEIVLKNDTDSLTTRYSHCKKHPKHENFIPVTKFSVNDLPPEHQNLKMMNELFRRCALTVRIGVSYTSLDRPNTFADSKAPYPFSEYKGSDRVMRYGTGSIVQAFYQHESLKVKSCPCRVCKISGLPERKYWWVRVRTATHVIHDRSEAERAEFDLFFDTDDKKGVRTIYGFDTFNAMVGSGKKYRNDVCDVLCVTHDWNTVEAISRINPEHNFLHPPPLSSGQAPSRVIVSHPHGCSKKLTIGNILHLTVPIGEDYPVDSEIPFKKGTVYRKLSQSRKCDSENLESELSMETKKSSDKCKSPTVRLQDYNLKEKLNSLIKTSPNTTTSETNVASSSSSTTETSFSKDEYLVDFYNLFLREHCLKILLVCTILYQRNEQRRGKKGVNHQELLKPVFEEVFRTFLGKELEITSNFEEEDNEIGTLSSHESESLLLHRYWLQLWKESEKEYERFKSLNDLSSSSKMELCPSLIVLWFDEVEKLIDSVVLTKLKEGKLIDEDVLPPVVEMGLTVCVKILMRFEELSKKNQSHSLNPRQEQVEMKDDDNDNEQNGDNDKKEIEEENYENVPDGATFTLPPKAEYAFRVYGDNPGWITFPPGTLMKMPDGIQVETEHPLFEFKPPSIQPEQCYVMYNTNTCTGSSGANVYCDILGKYLGTYFPHSGHTMDGNGSNRSGIRDNFYTLFSKMLLFDPSDVLGRERGDGEGKQSQNEPPNLFEGCRLILLNLKKILSK